MPRRQGGQGPEEAVAGFAPSLLAWFETDGRKDLPWQRRPTPYRVWVSEIMLQQTQVATAIPYYQRFMKRFPDLESLASARLDEVLHLWSGLGYYARARNLHRAARNIVAEGNGFPGSLEELMRLPGVGRSTAGAILALSRGERHPILDGNVKRVLSRHFGIEGEATASAVEKKLWALAESCTPAEDVARYTQAIMDLGATVCTRSNPLCLLCPVNSSCLARLHERQALLPAPRRRAERPLRKAWVVIALRGPRRVLLERRGLTPSSGAASSSPAPRICATIRRCVMPSAISISRCSLCSPAASASRPCSATTIAIAGTTRRTLHDWACRSPCGNS